MERCCSQLLTVSQDMHTLPSCSPSLLVLSASLSLSHPSLSDKTLKVPLLEDNQLLRSASISNLVSLVVFPTATTDACCCSCSTYLGSCACHVLVMCHVLSFSPPSHSPVSRCCLTLRPCWWAPGTTTCERPGAIAIATDTLHDSV